MYPNDYAVDIPLIPCQPRYKSDVLGWMAPMGLGRRIFTAGAAALGLLLASPGLAAAGSSAPPTIYAAPGGSGVLCAAFWPCSLAGAQQRVRALDRDMRAD